ncbi:LysR family transcriptional regulator [Paracidovorax citrulli]
MKLNPTDISAFLAVARSGNVGRAALQLQLTQPSVSKAIQRLERETGVTLFERGSMGVRLTAEGHLFGEVARRLEAQYAETVRTAEELRAHHAGLLRLGITNPASDGIAILALGEMIRKRPGLRATLTIGKSDALNQAVEDGRLDLAIVPSYPAYRFTCAQLEVSEDRMRLVARVGHPVHRLASPQAADLSAFGWIMPDRHSAARRMVSDIFEREGAPSPRVVVEVDYSSEAVVGLLCATDLLALIPNAMLRDWSGKLAPIAFPALQIQRGLSLLSRPGGHWSPLMTDFRDIVTGLLVSS